MTPKTGPGPRPRQLGLYFMQQCGSAIRNVVANAKFDFFICPSLKDLFGLNLFYLGKTHKSIFYREISCGHFTETPYQET